MAVGLLGPSREALDEPEHSPTYTFEQICRLVVTIGRETMTLSESGWENYCAWVTAEIKENHQSIEMLA